MKFDRSNKFDFYYYEQVIRYVRLKSSVTSKWASKRLWGVTFILLAKDCMYKLKAMHASILRHASILMSQKKFYLQFVIIHSKKRLHLFNTKYLYFSVPPSSVKISAPENAKIENWKLKNFQFSKFCVLFAICDHTSIERLQLFNTKYLFFSSPKFC